MRGGWGRMRRGSGRMRAGSGSMWGGSGGMRGGPGRMQGGSGRMRFCLCLSLCLAYCKRRRSARPAGATSHNAYGPMYSCIACRPCVGPPLVSVLPFWASGCSLSPVHPELCFLARLTSPVAPCTMLHSPCTFVLSLCPLGACFRPPRLCSSAGIRRADAQRDHCPGPRVCSYAGAIGHPCACASLAGRPDSCRVLCTAASFLCSVLPCPCANKRSGAPRDQHSGPGDCPFTVPHMRSGLLLPTPAPLPWSSLLCSCTCGWLGRCDIYIYIYHGWLVLVAAEEVRFCGRPSDDGLTDLLHLQPLPLPSPCCWGG